MSPPVLAILAPLAGAAAILMLRRAAPALALTGALLGLAASLRLLVEVGNGPYQHLLPGLPNLPLRLTVEPLTALLSVLVAAVGTLVLLYAVGYMQREPGRVRFFALMSAFVAAMQTLVLAGDWLLLLAAWELIGLCSYLLIGFWFQRPEAAGAASRAFLYTRTADLGLYLAVFVIIGRSGSSEIATSLGAGGSAILGAGLLVAAMGKSAQVPLQDWLMRAMAGPTPVSALLHSATLVAAGAILLIRAAPLLSHETLLAVGIVGGITTVITGLIALAERDLKRALAASTASQYGLMLVAVGAGVPVAALLHLIAHAAIKSSLFLGAGVFQHARGGTAFARLEGVGRARPRMFFGFVVAALALVGVPPLSGFFTKDAIVAAVLSADTAWLLGPPALAGILLTGAYMARALRRLWRGKGNEQPVAGMRWMGAAFSVLALAAVVLGAAVGPVEHLLGASPPTNRGGLVAGLTAAVLGLLLGWLFPARRLLGPLYPAARRGFAIAGGFERWIARPARAMAHGCEGLERRLYAFALAVGRAGIVVGRLVRSNDERGLDALIFSLVGAIRAMGVSARALQCGLVHRELALSAAGVAAILGFLVWMVLRH